MADAFAALPAPPALPALPGPAEGTRAGSAGSAGGENAIEIRGLTTRFGDRVVHDRIELDVRRAETFAIVGGSGTGKSTLLREMILLHRPQAGQIRLLGEDVLALDEEHAGSLRQRIGVMFQKGGLFASMTVAENVGMPLREFTHLPDALVDELATRKIAMTGLEAEAGLKYPSELSGGMAQRAALARAIALDPELLFLDEPTAGLDPTAADGVGTLVRQLRDALGLTVVIITHDLDLLWQVTDRVAVLGRGKVRGVGSMKELSAMDDPDIRPFFDTPRARAALQDAARRGDTAHAREGR
jgi:phospholipid/cholesterol/gamma-HCH transport system ATP-binding protein